MYRISAGSGQNRSVPKSKNISAFLINLAIIWSAALVVFSGLFMLATKGSQRLSGSGISHRQLTLRLAYLLIPIGIFAWIAFSLPTIMINYGYIISVVSDSLGLGWDLLGTAHLHFKPFIPDWIPVIQRIILLVGLYFGISRGFRSVAELLPGSLSQSRAMLLPSVFALAVINMLLKLYLG